MTFKALYSCPLKCTNFYGSVARFLFRFCSVFHAFRNITLNVLVADNGDPQLTSDVLVIIDVVDQNDVNPEFSSDSYQFSIFENASQGMSFYSIYTVLF